ncbi:MAG TPA: hypothetical protein VK611_25000 [Acidimicrobiales bacterium]|nr:hypothetical protein [Acidimicrobiales bacterium]
MADTQERDIPASFRDPVVLADTARVFRMARARCRCPQDCPCGRGKQEAS